MLGLVNLSGDETVIDVGCGNGAYPAELARHGHSGPVLGLDLAPGILAAARSRAPRARLIAADAAALPLRSGVSDLTLAMHMLHHVPDAQAAVRELRRITRPGGHVFVALRGEDHLWELRSMIAVALPGAFERGWNSLGEPLCLDVGAELVGREFQSVARLDFMGEIRDPSPRVVMDYIKGMLFTQTVPAPEVLIEAVGDLIRDRQPWRIRTHSGFLVCA